MIWLIPVIQCKMRDALEIIEPKVAKMANILAQKAAKHGKVPAVG